MTSPYVWFVLCVVVTIAACLAAPAVLRAISSRRGVTERIASVVKATDHLADALTRQGAALVTGIVGVGLIVGLLWPLGWLARGLEQPVDVPVLEWAGRHQNSRWADLNETFTVIGNNRPIQLVILLSAIPLALLWRRRGWWIPLLIVPGTYVVCRVAQAALGSVIGRNLPPTSNGDYPSGGVARTICVYGIIVVLIIVVRDVRARAAWMLVSLVVLVGVIEAYTRTILQKHWVTDAAAGVIFGLLLLAAGSAALWVLARTTSREAPEPAYRSTGAP